MKKVLPILMLLAVFGLSNSIAQTTGGQHSNPMPVIKSGIMKFENIDPKWKPTLQHKASENGGPDEDALRTMKVEKMLLKQQNNLIISSSIKDNNYEKNLAAVTPVIGTNFQGNNTSGCPQDNTIAISNGGKIASLVNSDVEYYNQNSTFISGQTLVNFYNDNTLSTNICDPKVIYDSQADRFIFYAQTCDGTSSSSVVIVSFSQTNDPSGLWWYYELTGNPNNDASWFDYPKIAVSTDEVFVTGNLFHDAGGFNESVVYQIDKNVGYAGTSMVGHWVYWNGISGSPFTILPVGSGHSGNFGPGIYLVNTFANGASSINLYHINNNQYNTPTMSFNSVTTTAYSPGTQAAQNGTTHILDNGDCRAMNGFYLNGIIHFVFCCDIGSGWNGINYNRLNVSAQTNTSTTFGSVGNYDYCYPAVGSISTSLTDKSVVIAFTRSSSTIYPETRVVGCDDGSNWSGSVLVKVGDHYVDQCFDSNHSADRWGDYTGIARKYNNNHLWMSGSYGGSSGFWNTWLAEIYPSTTGISELNNTTPKTTHVYPNPISNLFTMDLYATESGSIKASIFDLNGKLVKLLYEGYIWKGENTFSFDKGNLENGNYFLTIENNQKVISHEAINILR